MTTDRRLLLVHAHPDDESILTGATMAHYLAQGARVVCVTCTQGEEGEVIPPELAHLAPDRDDELGPYRIGELAEALKAVGGPEHHWLGGSGRWRDSGMAGTGTTERPECFWQADLAEAADELVPIIRELRPQVLVIEDPAGGYQHPDHIKSHRVATYATALAAAPSHLPEAGEAWAIPKVYWMTLPRSAVADGLAAIAARPCPFEIPKVDDLLRVRDDAMVTTLVDAQAHVEAKRAALAAHRTQVTVDGHDCFALSNNIAQPLDGREYFRLVAGYLGPMGDNGLETDLFAGVT